MNWEQIEANWMQMRGQVKQRWGELTDDDIDVIDGKRDQLVGRIQERRAIAREQAEREVDEFARQLGA